MTCSAGWSTAPGRRSTIGFAAIGFAIIVGASIGALAGYAGGMIDNVLMRFMDVLLAFPSLLLAIAIVTALGPSLTNALFAIGIVSIPIYARIVRASVFDTKERDFVTASRALGESRPGHPAPADPAQLADAARRAGHARASAAPSSRSPPCHSSA